MALAWILPVFLPAASHQGVKDGIFRPNLTFPRTTVGFGPPPFSLFLVSRRDRGRRASHFFEEDASCVLQPGLRHAVAFVSVAPNAQQRAGDVRGFCGGSAPARLSVTEAPAIAPMSWCCWGWPPPWALAWGRRAAAGPRYERTPTETPAPSPPPHPRGPPICSRASFPGRARIFPSFETSIQFSRVVFYYGYNRNKI